MTSLVSRVATGRAAQAPLPAANPTRLWLGDHALLLAIMTLGLFGAVMIASASMAIAHEMTGSPFYFVTRQIFFLSLGAFVGVLVFRLPLAVWEQYGPHLIVLSLFFLVLVLVPGIGREVNGSRRWIDLGLFTVQVSESVKLFIIVYLSGYLVRRGYLVQNTFGGFLRPLVLITAASALLLLEPDFGAAVVIVSTAMIMLFVAGVRFVQFAALLTALGSLGAILIVQSPYRMRRFALYAFIVFRCFVLARLADQQGNRFAGFIALGIGIWIGLQSFVNMGVNMGRGRWNGWPCDSCPGGR